LNRKIEKVREDIRKAETRAREAEEYVKTLRAKERQLEDEEIIAQIRAMQGKGADIMDVLRDVQNRKRSDSEPAAGEERGGMEHDL
jgi:hypothetical protein